MVTKKHQSARFCNFLFLGVYLSLLFSCLFGFDVIRFLLFRENAAGFYSADALMGCCRLSIELVSIFFSWFDQLSINRLP